MAVLAALSKTCLTEDLSKTGKDFRNSLQQEGSECPSDPISIGIKEAFYLESLNHSAMSGTEVCDFSCFLHCVNDQAS